jgi:hypothetical protein
MDILYASSGVASFGGTVADDLPHLHLGLLPANCYTIIAIQERDNTVT